MGGQGSGHKRGVSMDARRDREIVRLRRRGVNLAEIARRVGCHPSTVAAALERQGYAEPLPRPRGLAAMTAERRRRIASKGGRAKRQMRDREM